MSTAADPDSHPGGAQSELAQTINVGGDLVHGDKTVTQIAGGDIVGRDQITNNYYRAPSWGEVKHRRNREAMIQNVRSFWVKGVLENSLYGAVLLRLGLEFKPEAVEQPWNVVVRRAEEPDRSLTSDTRMIDIFDEAGGALLILGAPGSGKTTTLLELARDLLTRAEQDGTALVPVIFPLASWAEARPALADWLVEELVKRYDVPRKVGATWVKQDMLLPLLDGLDEVQAEHREACAQAINAFRAEHGLTPLVVCSRIADYEALITRLRLHTAVMLQPLTPEQVDAHLAKLGPNTATVRSLLATDEGLRELAATPMMLSIMLAVYQDANAAEVAALETLEARRTHVFERYVQRVLERPTELRVYTPAQSQPGQGDQRTRLSYSTHETLHWLAWLARSMKTRSQSIFYLEWMQPNWLPTSAQQRIATFSVPIIVLSSLLFVGLFGLVVVGLVDAGSGRAPVDVLRDLLVGGLLLVLAGGLHFGLVTWLGGYSKQIKPVEVIHWWWSRARSSLLRSLLGGLIAGLAGGLGVRLVGAPVSASVILPGVALLGGLVVGLVSGLVSGLVADEITTRKSPNEGMHRSARNALAGGLVVGPLSGLVGGLAGGLFVVLVDVLSGKTSVVVRRDLLSVGPSFGLIFGVVSGLISGLVSGLNYGGRAYLQHLTLRFLLWRNGSTPTPRNHVQFLDYAAERVLLRKVGGGYIFIHRLLLEYFAGLEN